MRSRTARAAALFAAMSAAALFGACDPGPGKANDSAPAGGTAAPARTVLTFTPPGVTSGGPKAGTPQPGAVTPPKQPCQKCATQEDFDDAQKKGRSCCPVQACISDAGCSGGRVCCKIPGGTLCTDAGRCSAGDRVKEPSRTPHAACRTMSDCPEGDLCCDTGAGPGKPGKCMGVSDGIKGCAAPP